MERTLPYIFLLVTFAASILNFLAFMQLISLLITLPLLFISIYLTIFSFTHKRAYRGMR